MHHLASGLRLAELVGGVLQGSRPEDGSADVALGAVLADRRAPERRFGLEAEGGCTFRASFASDGRRGANIQGHDLMAGRADRGGDVAADEAGTSSRLTIS